MRPSQSRSRAFFIALSLSFSLVACDGGDDRDAGGVDAGGPLDSGSRDAGPPDDAGTDAGPADAGTDAGSPVDAGPVDAGADAGMDAGSADAGPSDAGPVDAGPADAGPPVDAGAFVGGDTCAMAFDVTAGGTFRGTTVGASDTYDDALPCSYGSGSNGAEVVYSVTPSTATNYRVTVTADSAADVLQLWTRTDCGSDACPDGSRGALMFAAPAGVTTFLFVEDQEFIADGFPFTLEVTIE